MQAPVWSKLCVDANASSRDAKRKASFQGDRVLSFMFHNGALKRPQALLLRFIFSACPRIENVLLEGIALTSDSGLEAICGLENLRIFQYEPWRDVHISGTSFSALSKCKLLQEVRIYGCVRLADASVLSFESCSHLKVVDFTGCKRLGDAVLAAIAKCPLLEEVSFSYSRFLTNISPLRHCKHLRKLSSSNCPALEHIAALAECRMLTDADFSAGDTDIDPLHFALDPDDLVQALAHCPLVNLNLFGRLGITNVHPLAKCVQLKELKLNFVDLDDASLQVLSSCSLLEEIGFAQCRAGSVGVSSFSRCPNLTKVTFAWFEALTDEGILALSACTLIEELNLPHCGNLTDASSSVLPSWKNLRCVSLTGCYRLTRVTVRALVQCPCVESVLLNRCPLLPSQLSLERLFAQNRLQLKRFEADPEGRANF